MSNSKYAGFWIRFVAYVIDGFLLGTVSSFLVLPLLGLVGINIPMLESGNTEDWLGIIAIIASLGTAIYLTTFILGWLYFALLESGSRQASIGKMAVGVKVVGINGERISFGRASLRYFGKYVSGAIMMIGYIMAAFTENKQALHDYIANTFVKYKS